MVNIFILLWKLQEKQTGGVNMGWQLPPVYRKKGPKYYDNKTSKIDAKIAKLEQEKAIYVAKRAEFDEPKTEVVEG